MQSPSINIPASLEAAKTIDYDTLALAVASRIPLVFTTVYTGGYFVSGDGGSAQYKRVPADPGTAGKFQDASGAWFELIGSVVNLRAMGAKGDGVTSDRTALVNAIAKANGAPIYAPRGDYVIDSPIIVLINPVTTTKFGPGVKIYGDGIDVTYFTYTGNTGYMLDIDSSNHVAPNDNYVMNCEFSNFTVRGKTALTNNGALKLRTCYHTIINTCKFSKLKGTGVRLASSVIDFDANTYTQILNCTFEECTEWGINARADVATNSTSFVKVDMCRFQYCGTTDGAYQPTSGATAWKGLIAEISNCGYTLNYNVCLWIPGEANLANRITVWNTDFENSFARGIFSRGIVGFKAWNLELLANNAGPTSIFVEFEGNDFTIQDVEIDGVTVRAGNGITNTAFKLSGVNVLKETCRVKNVYWLDYDYPNQTRFDGWTFDPVVSNGVLTLISATSIEFRANQLSQGNTVPLRLAGPRAQSPGGVASKSGELVTGRYPNAIAISNAGLAPSSFCYFYSKDNGNGGVQIVVNNTAPVFNNDFGLAVMTGEPAYIYLGRWQTNASSQFITTGTGFLNPARVPGSLALNYFWREAGGGFRVNASLPNSDTDGQSIS